MKALAREVHALDPNLAPLITDRLQDQIDEISYSQRLAVTLVAIFGAMALFLAAIGLYAVVSYTVSQGTRELGLRMALGADAKDLMRLVMSRGLLLTASGIAIGAIAAIVLTRLMGDLLYKSKSTRSTGVWNGIRSNHDRFFGCMFFARLARDTHRSGPGSARTMMN